MRAAGIDVGKANLDLAIEGQSSGARFPNNRAGISKLIKRLRAERAERIVVEATGGFEEPLLDACCDAGLWIARVNPRQARDFARATGELAKTDAIDARLLALMAGMFGDRLRRHVATTAEMRLCIWAWGVAMSSLFGQKPMRVQAQALAKDCDHKRSPAMKCGAA